MPLGRPREDSIHPIMVRWNMPSTETSRPEIDWEEYNYPPCCRLWHYKPSELEDRPRSVARLQYASYLLMMLALIVNTVTNIVCAIGGVRNSGLHVMYSFFDLLIGGILGMYLTVDLGYKGVAQSRGKTILKWLCMWGALTVAMLPISIIASSQFNGWLRVLKLLDRRRTKPSPPIRVAWMVGALIESILWTCCMATSCWTLHRAYLLRRDGPRSMTSMKAKLKASAGMGGMGMQMASTSVGRGVMRQAANFV